MAVHYGVGSRSPKPACGAGAAWARSGGAQITTTRGTAKVDCKACQKTSAFKAAGKPVPGGKK